MCVEKCNFLCKNQFFESTLFIDLLNIKKDRGMKKAHVTARERKGVFSDLFSNGPPD